MVEKKNLKKVLVVWKTFSTFAIPNREKRKRRRRVNKHHQNTFRVTKKNFKKVLVVWKKLFTFALANQGQQ